MRAHDLLHTLFRPAKSIGDGIKYQTKITETEIEDSFPIAKENLALI